MVTDVGRTLGRVLADLCNWINLAAVVLGGALGTAGQPMIDGVRESINRYAHTGVAESLEIKTTQLGLRSEAARGRGGRLPAGRLPTLLTHPAPSIRTTPRSGAPAGVSRLGIFPPVYGACTTCRV